MAPSSDSYRNFRFRVIWNGRYAAGFADASPLPVDLKSSRQRESGGPPPAIGPEGQGTPFFINLDRGITFDLSFEQWITMVRCYGPATGKGSLLVEYKRPLAIEMIDDTGNVVFTYHLSRCWVTEYTAFPKPDAISTEIAVEHLRLGFEAWRRDPPDDG